MLHNVALVSANVYTNVPFVYSKGNHIHVYPLFIHAHFYPLFIHAHVYALFIHAHVYALFIHAHVCPLFKRLFSRVGHYRVLSRVVCATRRVYSLAVH